MLREEQIVGQQSKGSENPEKHEGNDLNYSAFLLLRIFLAFLTTWHVLEFRWVLC